MQETLPHAVEQLSPCAATIEAVPHNYWSPHTPEPMLGNKEAIVMRSPHTATGEEPPLTSAREEPARSNEDPARPKIKETNRSVQFSRSVVSNSLWPHGLQHARLLCPSPTPRACINSCSSSEWCHPTISSFVIHFCFCLHSFPESGSFQLSHSLHQVAKYWSFSFNIGPSNKYSGLISFRIDWLDLSHCSPRDSQESSPTSQFKSINFSVLSFLCSLILTSIHDY